MVSFQRGGSVFFSGYSQWLQQVPSHPPFKEVVQSSLLPEIKGTVSTLPPSFQRGGSVCFQSSALKKGWSTLPPSFQRGGSGNIAVTNSDGTEHLIPTRRGEKHWMEKIAQVESRLDKRTKGSRGYERLMKARRKMHNKASFQHVDHQRKLSHALCVDVDLIVVGKTRTRLGLARKKDSTPEQHHGVQNTGNMSRLKTFIKEKCVERGIVYLELPDPSREGDLTDPDSKFLASRKLLVLASKTAPTEYIRKKFWFNQGGKKRTSNR